MEKYIIKNEKTGKFIGIDLSTGGYPYDTNIENAKIWSNKLDAYNYWQTMNETQWSLNKLVFELTEINWYDIKK